MLTPADHAELMQIIRLVRSTSGDKNEPDRHHFMGTPLEVEVAGPSVLVAVDGSMVPLFGNA